MNLFQPIFLFLQVQGFVSSLERKLERRIYGGKDGPATPYDFLVNILYAKEHLGCGGTRYTKDIVITAGHCVMSCDGDCTKDYTVFANMTRLSDRESSKTVEVLKVKETIRHPKYIAGNVAHKDIAVFKLNLPVSKERIIELDHSKAPPKLETSVLTMGWGFSGTKDGKPSHPDLFQEVQLDVQPQAFCKEAYTLTKDSVFYAPDGSEFKPSKYQIQYYENHYDKAQEFCAAKPGKFIGAAPHDSGGPIISKPSNTLVGVISYAECKSKDKCKPTVGVQVNVFANWVDDNVNKLHDKYSD